MSHYDITTGVVDVDAKGETGVGTVFYMDIAQGSGEDRRLLEHHVWGLLDELAGRFDPKAVAQVYRTANADLDKAASTSTRAQPSPERLAKAQVLAPALEALLDAAVASETAAIAQYRAGKDKALNSVVGKILGAAKQQGLTADPFQITHFLKARLAAGALP